MYHFLFNLAKVLHLKPIAMKNNRYFFGLCVIAFQNLYAQPNLIPNPSFEEKTDTNLCLEEPVILSYEFATIVANWKADDIAPPVLVTSSRNTPDYFDTCADAALSASVNVPQNYAGYQNAKDGNAYIGIAYGYREALSSSNPIPGATSEYVFTELIAPLEAGETYTFSMYVSKAEEFDYAANQLGAAFVEDLPFENGFITSGTDGALTITPQILGNDVINDETNWTKIEGVFTAQGGEKYVIIGHFPNLQTLEVEENGAAIDYEDYFGTYYYIDDVSLRKGNLSTNVFNGKEVKVYPNPTENYFTIEGVESNEIKEVSLFDLNGKKLIVNIKNNVLDINHLSAGTYLLKIETTNGTVMSEKIVKK